MPEAGRRQRAAQNPARVTSKKKRQNTASAIGCNQQFSEWIWNNSILSHQEHMH
jgi:hypothetical protein